MLHPDTMAPKSKPPSLAAPVEAQSSGEAVRSKRMRARALSPRPPAPRSPQPAAFASIHQVFTSQTVCWLRPHDAAPVELEFEVRAVECFFLRALLPRLAVAACRSRP